MKKITFIGTGYVGLVSGTGISDFGHKVICADISKEKIKQLNDGFLTIYEPGLDELFAKHHKDEKIIWIEPSELAVKDPAFMSAVERNLIAGAVMCASDESGDARIFAKKLAAELENRGVEIHTDCKVTDFVSQRGCVKGVSTEKGGFSADRVVLSSGVASRALRIIRAS